MSEKNDDLEMGLFSEGSSQELDFTFGPGSEAVDEPAEGENEIEGFGPPAEEQDNLSDDESQESVAEKSGTTDEDQIDSDDNSSPNVYHDLAAVFKEQGLLSSTNEKEIKDLDGFVSAFKEEIKASELADLTDSQREYLEAVRNGVPEARYQEHQEDLSNLEKITSERIEADGELRRRIIFQNLVNQGLSENDASKFVQRSVDNGLDVDDASDALPNIKAYNQAQYSKEVEAAKTTAANALKQVEKDKADLKNAILSPEKNLFKDYEISPHVAETVYKKMNTVVNHREDGTPENSLMKFRRENPIEFDAKLHLLFSLTNDFSDLESFTKKGTSNAISNLERTLQQGGFKPSGGNPSFIDNPEGYSGFGDELVFE